MSMHNTYDEKSASLARQSTGIEFFAMIRNDILIDEMDHEICGISCYLLGFLCLGNVLENYPRYSCLFLGGHLKNMSIHRYSDL